MLSNLSFGGFRFGAANRAQKTILAERDALLHQKVAGFVWQREFAVFEKRGKTV